VRALALTAAALVIGAAAPVPVTGTWLTEEGKALVRIEPCGAQLCGRIVRVLRPRPGGGRALDTANHDPALRSRPIEGLAILTGFTRDDDQWAGRIYDPESGRSYRSTLARHGDTLDVKGCLGPFCRTQHWTAQR
jgi:uncharacterized protein (DUF2147 family)